MTFLMQPKNNGTTYLTRYKFGTYTSINQTFEEFTYTNSDYFIIMEM